MNAIEIIGVSKTFKILGGRKNALENLSLDVRQGEVFGFIGPNGAGKSTAIKLLLNFIRPDSGVMRVMGKTVGLEAFQRVIGYLPETPCFLENLTAIDLLRFVCRTSTSLLSDGFAQRIDDALDRLSLAAAATQPVRTYSKGMKQRLGLAMALIHDPELFIFDEPMSGLDPLGRRLVADVIRGLRAVGKTVFFSTHILSDVEQLSDRVGVINRGRLLYEGDAAGLKAGRSLEDAFISLVEMDDGKGSAL